MCSQDFWDIEGKCAKAELVRMEESGAKLSRDAHEHKVTIAVGCFIVLHPFKRNRRSLVSELPTVLHGEQVALLLLRRRWHAAKTDEGNGIPALKEACRQLVREMPDSAHHIGRDQDTHSSSASARVLILNIAVAFIGE